MAIPDACMYSETLHKLSAWEIEACPWWMDMEKDHVLARERDLRDAMLSDTASDVIGASSEPTLSRAAGVEFSPGPPTRLGDLSSGRDAVSYSKFRSYNIRNFCF